MLRTNDRRHEGDVALHPAPRRIVHRTRGRTHGPITRLMSPGDLGDVLKPFVFLDHIDLTSVPFNGIALHPHSGIATVTYLFEGSVTYEDTTGQRGKLHRGSLEWLRAGHGAWHGGGADGNAPARGFQLWLALGPEHELGEVESIYLPPGEIPDAGPARNLLGGPESALPPPSPLSYQAVRLAAGERWSHQPAAGHTVAWAALSRGALRTPDPVDAGELVIFEPGSGPIEFEAQAAAEFVVGSAPSHPHDLVLGHYSVHTSQATLEAGEARIAEIGQQLRGEGRL
jgi:redox-sensitive bicupin YhaK (pirin superfamily)